MPSHPRPGAAWRVRQSRCRSWRIARGRARTTVGRQNRSELSVFRKGIEGRFGHGVYRKWSRKSFDIEDVRRIRILSSGAGPQ